MQARVGDCWATCWRDLLTSGEVSFMGYRHGSPVVTREVGKHGHRCK